MIIPVSIVGTIPREGPQDFTAWTTRSMWLWYHFHNYMAELSFEGETLKAKNFIQLLLEKEGRGKIRF